MLTCTGEFSTQGSGAGGGVVFGVVEPDEVGDPARMACQKGDGSFHCSDQRILLEMRIASHHDVVANVVVRESLECAVLVRDVAIPSIAVVRILFGTKPGGDVDAREHNLATNEAPSSSTLTGSDELTVEPARSQ